MGSSGTGRRILGAVRDGSGDPRGGPRLVMGPWGMFGTGRGTLGEVWDGLGRSGTG